MSTARSAVIAAGSFEVELFGEGWKEAGLPLGLAGESRGVAVLSEAEDRPEFHEPVEAIQAEGVLDPAWADGFGDVAIAGPVNLLDPGAQSAEGLFTLGPAEFPPPSEGNRLMSTAVWPR